MNFIIKVRTPEEALLEFQKDLNSRINYLENRLAGTKKATESGKIAYALSELRRAKSMWDEMIIDSRPER